MIQQLPLSRFFALWLLAFGGWIFPRYGFANGWTADLHNPGDIIQNQGQYQSIFPQGVSYVIDYGYGWQAGFGPNGVEILIRTSREHRETLPTGPAVKQKIQEEQRIQAVWENLAPGHYWAAEHQRQAYYTFGPTEEGAGQDFAEVPAYGEIWLRQAWSGIDIQYTSPKDGGLKYTLYLAPGADLSQARLRYGVEAVRLDAQGNIRIPTLLGDMVDHAPIAHYADGNQESVAVRFRLVGGIIEFDATGRDLSRPLVIDPWTVNPALPAPFNRAFEVDWDNAGNVYVFGGGMGYQLKKYNAAGTLQWTHVSPWDTSNAWFGELLVTGAGDSYITSGSAAKIRRVNTAGGTVFTNNGPFFNLDEYWNLTLNCDKTQLIAGGSRIIGFTSPQGHVFNLNMGSGGQITGSPYNVSPAFMKEIRALCTGSNGNFYLLSNDNVIALNQSFGIIYSVSSGYAYPYYSPSYMAQSVQGQNSIDADQNFIYTMNGPNLHRRAIGTGAIVATATIPGGSASGGFGGSGANNGGLRIDNCSNVYVGSTNAVHKFNSGLGLVTSVSTSGPVYDVEVAPGGLVLIGGSAFVTSNTSLAPCTTKVISCVILDATVAQFEARCEGGLPAWNWVSAKEKAGMAYAIEISEDGLAWQSVAQLDAVAEGHTYHYRMDMPLPSGGIQFSRLKMTDPAGNTAYSGVQTLENCASSPTPWTVFPTQTTGNLTVEWESESESPTVWRLFDLQGRTVKWGYWSGPDGWQQSTMDISTLPAGIYLLRLDGSDQVEKVVKE